MSLVSICMVLAMGQSHVAQNLPRLDMHATRRLLHTAERELAGFRLTQPRTSRVNPKDNLYARILRGVPGAILEYDRVAYKPSLVEHRGNPMVDRYLEFRCRYVMTTSSVDAVAVEHDESRFVPTDALDANEAVPEHYYVVHGAISGKFTEKEYPFAFFFSQVDEKLTNQLEAAKAMKRVTRKDEIETTGRRGVKQVTRKEAIKKTTAARRQALGDYRKMIRGIEHQLLLQLPAGFRPPDKPFKRFKAEVKVLSVQFDRSANFPRFIIHAQLIRSKMLNLDYAGILDPNKTR